MGKGIWGNTGLADSEQRQMIAEVARIRGWEATLSWDREDPRIGFSSLSSPRGWVH